MPLKKNLRTNYCEIPIDFDVWKKLLSLRREESMSYNDVLRELLGIDQIENVNPEQENENE